MSQNNDVKKASNLTQHEEDVAIEVFKWVVDNTSKTILAESLLELKIIDDVNDNVRTLLNLIATVVTAYKLEQEEKHAN